LPELLRLPPAIERPLARVVGQVKLDLGRATDLRRPSARQGILEMVYGSVSQDLRSDAVAEPLK